ncbi:MAG: UDP-N-acetylmuramate dehydrogenase [Chitinispirillales bacterium]|jgi:UDP-N-acetylmuramate dehydrogenase|nr:UDP-N-acetylmuramate dehydrogenase [Chitinispirillales bacterium]
MLNLFENIPLKDKTSYKIGGAAKFYSEPRSEEEIIELYRFALQRGLSVFVLGNGSNVVVSDEGLDGLVINLSVNFSKLDWDGSSALVSSGFSLDELAEAAAQKRFGGMEELSGIPGTIGGAVVMNAGAFNTEISHTLRSVRILKISTLTIETIPASELAFGYRQSAIKNSGNLVLSAIFDFKLSPDATQIRQRILDKREQKQPLDFPNCGSVFKRPPGNYAGTLIESCGLKGFKAGGAMVSPKHANFIVNTGNALAEDVRSVILHIQKTVFDKTGILLEPEVIFIGKFSFSLLDVFAGGVAGECPPSKAGEARPPY